MTCYDACLRPCCLKLKARPTAQHQWPSVSTKEHGNVTLGFAIAPHTLSRRAGRRLMTAAAMPRSTLWQANASGRQRMTDQACNRFHVTRLIRHRLSWQWRWNVAKGRSRGCRWHLSPTPHQHRACLDALTATRHQECRALFYCTEMQPARDCFPMLAYCDHTHTSRSRDHGRIEHALAVIK